MEDPSMEAKDDADVLQISSPTLTSLEEEEVNKEEEAAKAGVAAAAEVKDRRILKRGASQEEGDRAADKAKHRKKSWSSLKAEEGEADAVVSSGALKDLVPSVTSIMEKNGEQEDEEGEDEEGDHGGKEEEGDKDKAVEEGEAEEEDPNDEGAFVKVTNLVRPFTLNQLKTLLSRTGDIDEDSGFFINKIKSVCIVRYLRSSSARDTVSALDNVRWPSTNPKSLSVALTDAAEFDSCAAGGEGAVTRPAAAAAERSSRLMGNQQSRKEDRPAAEGDGKSAEAAKAPKPLEELFKSTKATPLLYWKPAVDC